MKIAHTLVIFIFSFLSPYLIEAQIQPADVCEQIVDAIPIHFIENIATQKFTYSCNFFTLDGATAEIEVLPGNSCTFKEFPTVWHKIELTQPADILQIKVEAEGRWSPIYSVYYGSCDNLIQLDSLSGNVACNNLDLTPDIHHVDLTSIDDYINQTYFLAISSNQYIHRDPSYNVCLASYMEICNFRSTLNVTVDTVFTIENIEVPSWREPSDCILSGDKLTYCVDYEYNNSQGGDWMIGMIPSVEFDIPIGTFNFDAEWVDSKSDCAAVAQEDLPYLCTYRNNVGELIICNLLYEICPCETGVAVGDTLPSGWYVFSDSPCLGDCQPNNNYGEPSSIFQIEGCFVTNTPRTRDVRIQFISDDAAGCRDDGSSSLCEMTSIKSNTYKDAGEFELIQDGCCVEIIPSSNINLVRYSVSFGDGNRKLLWKELQPSYVYCYDEPDIYRIQIWYFDQLGATVSSDIKTVKIMEPSDGTVHIDTLLCSSSTFNYNISTDLNNLDSIRVVPLFNKSSDPTNSNSSVEGQNMYVFYESTGFINDILVNSLDTIERAGYIINYYVAGDNCPKKATRIIIDVLPEVRTLANNIQSCTPDSIFIDVNDFIELGVFTEDAELEWHLNGIDPLSTDNSFTFLPELADQYLELNLKTTQGCFYSFKIDIDHEEQSRFIGGTLWIDTDSNSMFADENTPANIKINITSFDNGFSATTYTNQQGKYSFFVKEGIYNISIDPSMFLDSGLLGSFYRPCDEFVASNIVVDNDNNVFLDNASELYLIHNLQVECEEISKDFIEDYTWDMCLQRAFCVMSDTSRLVSTCEEILENPDLYTFCNISALDGFCTTTKAEESQNQESAICPDNIPTIDNTSWFSFVGGKGEYDLEFLMSDCSVLFASLAGIKIGIFENCNLDEPVFCSLDCFDESFVISTTLEEGITYYVGIDGCFGSVCDVQINVICKSENCDDASFAEPFDWLISNCDEDKYCANVEYEIEVETTDDYDVPLNWTIRDVNLDAVDTLENEDQKINYSFSRNSTYELCILLKDNCKSSQFCNLLEIEALESEMQNLILCPGDEITPTFEYLDSMYLWNEAIVAADNMSGESMFIDLDNVVETNCGCPVTLRVSAEILSRFENQVVLTDCIENFPITYNGEEIAETGTYESNFMAINGCDSLVILEINGIESEIEHIDTLVCETVFPFDYMGVEIAAEGETSIVLDDLSSESCDSTIVLNVMSYQIQSPIINCILDTNQIIFVWDSVELVNLYEVSINGNIVSSQTSTEYLIDGLEQGEVVSISVQAFDINMCVSIASSLECVTPVISNVIDIYGVQSISIYPNPASEYLILDYEASENNKYEISIYNSQGGNKEYFLIDRQIDISEFNNGCYILQILDKTNSEIRIEKFVVIK